MAHTGGHVLIVDDEPDIRQLLVDALSGGQFHVDAVASRREALELLQRDPVDLVITDLRLSDGTGLDVLDAVRSRGDTSTILITGHGDQHALSEASRRQPVEMMLKPLDVERLRATVESELTRRRSRMRWRRRTRRLRRLARDMKQNRTRAVENLQSVCNELTAACRDLNIEAESRQAILEYQDALLRARNDDDVFRALFRLMVQRSGPVFGVAMACDAEAQLRVVGRFGVPQPDGLRFCELIAHPLIDDLLVDPVCTEIDATDCTERWDAAIRKYLVGVTVLAVPLKPSSGELIGTVILYRKGEQPFTEEDRALAEAVAVPTALAIQRNG